MCTDVHHDPVDEASTVVGSGNKEHSALLLCCWLNLCVGFIEKRLKTPNHKMLLHAEIIYFKGKQNVQ